MKLDWKKYLLYISLALITGLMIYVLVETVKAKNTGFETKSLWDWMDLLIIPLFLTTGAFILNYSERELDRQRTKEREDLERRYSEERARRENKAAEERALFERSRTQDFQREAALQSYLDRMSNLLLHENLLTTKRKEVREVARVLTLTVLRGLDGKRKGIVVLFLHNAKLIAIPSKGDPIVNLLGADLNEAELSGFILNNDEFGGANLVGADLRNAILIHSSFFCANLEGAKLVWANLGSVNLEGADLTKADLTHAYIQNATFQAAIMIDTIMPDGMKND